MSGGGGCSALQQPPKERGVTYRCVTDVQLTDRRKGKQLGQLTSRQARAGSRPKLQQMRLVGHVRQKDLDIPEATPIITEKICTGIAGLL